MSQFVKKVLPKADADAYAKAKFKIQAHNASAKSWWGALIEISENEWFLTEFPTMQEWCKKYTTWAPGTIQKAIQKARKEQAKKLIGDTTGEAIINESKETTQNDKGVEVAVPPGNEPSQNSKKHSSTPAEVDECGEPIPPHALKFWHRREEVKAVMKVIENLGKSCRERLNEGDPLWSGLPAQGVEMALHNAYHAVKNFLPYAVCTACQGHVANGSCEACHNTGMVSQFHFESFSDRLAKQIRDKNRKEQRANA